jgi:ABC-type sugar transport system permease subunit
MVQSTIGMFNLFTEPFILTLSDWQGGISNGGLTLMIYLLYKAPQGGVAYGYASACAYVITVIIIVITYFINKLMIEKEPKERHAV